MVIASLFQAFFILRILQNIAMKPDMDSTAAVLYCIAVVLCLILRTYFFGSTFLCVHIGGDNNDIMLFLVACRS